jgi:hypothetical protein
MTILAIATPAFISALLIALFGHETRGLDLHEIDAAGGGKRLRRGA